VNGEQADQMYSSKGLVIVKGASAMASRTRPSVIASVRSRLVMDQPRWLSANH